MVLGNDNNTNKNAQQRAAFTTVFLLTKWTFLACDSFLIISVCVALLSSPFRDAGLLGELSSLGEVAGLPLPADGLGIFTFMAKSLFSLQEKSWRVNYNNTITKTAQ